LEADIRHRRSDWRKPNVAAQRIENIAKDASLGLELLVDMRAAFEATGRDELPTKTLIGHLIADEDRP
jgi:hypothetical protein